MGFIIGHRAPIEFVKVGARNLTVCSEVCSEVVVGCCVQCVAELMWNVSCVQ